MEGPWEGCGCCAIGILDGSRNFTLLAAFFVVSKAVDAQATMMFWLDCKSVLYNNKNCGLALVPTCSTMYELNEKCYAFARSLPCWLACY